MRLTRTDPVLGGGEEVEEAAERAHAVELGDGHQLLHLVHLLEVLDLHHVLLKQPLQLVRQRLQAASYSRDHTLSVVRLLRKFL